MGGQDLKAVLGRNIKLLRFHRNLSQAELAEKAGISINFVSELERGNKWPRADTLSKVAKALDVPVSSLFEEGEAVTGETQAVISRFFEDLSRSASQSIETVCKQYAPFLSVSKDHR